MLAWAGCGELPAWAAGHKLLPSDTVQIHVVNQADLDTQARVEQDGTITFPYVGRLRVAGLTEDQVSNIIKTALEKADVVKLQLLVNKVPVDAVARVVHRSHAQRLGKDWVTKFKDHVDRQMFEVVIQAVAGKRVVARETIKPFRKDVLQKLHASDISRRRKLLEKQKEGRKKLRAVGNVVIDQKAFQGFFFKPPKV